jgi:hypothetical protein
MSGLKQSGFTESSLLGNQQAAPAIKRGPPWKKLLQYWPAAGFVDTAIGCFMKPEVADAATEVWA